MSKAEDIEILKRDVKYLSSEHAQHVRREDRIYSEVKALRKNLAFLEDVVEELTKDYRLSEKIQKEFKERSRKGG